jgi:Carboxypeptidase regulatory-like domain
MKRLVVATLLLSMAAQAQQRTSQAQRPSPPGSPGTVTLALSEYNRLAELVAHQPKPVEEAPVPVVVSNADFKVRIDGDFLVATLDIAGNVLKPGLTRVPLVSGLTILESQQPVPIFQDGSAKTAIVSGPGPFSISLKLASPITVDGGRAFFLIPVPAAGSAHLSLDIPGNHANIHVEPGLVTDRGSSGGHTTVEAALEPGKTTQVWWSTRETAAPVAQRDIRFLSDIKALASVGDAEQRLSALCDVTVIQGEPAEFSMPLPPGFELSEVSGSSLESTETQAGTLVLKVRDPSQRTHQFLVVIERPSRENKLDVPFLSLMNAQRETGELLVEGTGTMELTATEGGALKRIDVREVGAFTRSLARFPPLAAFRYHRRPGEPPKLMLEWTQFPDSPVLSAIAERATITTLLNSEGKSLTEVSLRVRNHAQPFVKIDLPQGATLLYAEVEGESVKPVAGTDGSRVPLLRSGFRPSDSYTVSFVYLGSGPRFEKKGTYQLALPKLDLPVTLLTWEVYLPDRLEVKQFDGNALSASDLPMGTADLIVAGTYDDEEANLNLFGLVEIDPGALGPGEVGGIVVDQVGAVVPGALIIALNTQTGGERVAKTDSGGRFAVSGLPPGPVRIKVESPGFKAWVQNADLTTSAPLLLGITLEVGAVTEMVTVTASGAELRDENHRIEREVRKAQQAQLNAPSQNVFSLQRRVAGVLPVRIDVPRAGKSYRFVRPLVLGDDTKIGFRYKSR